ncbi:sugar transferase [Vagococcus lutrae]|uniref:sugar transferase n=1 Tax=Vagococcus lutrae TaxID=81947 RepID=UPI00209699F1|nr:sugar transferase [Vagococcus lutrae]MCO7150875.1 sugar transferase [Vagococcus lutrae]
MEQLERDSILKNNYLYVKRLFDIIFSVALLALTFPLIIFFMILVRLESRGEAIYKQKRVGYKGNEFTIYKIRSMRNDAEENGAQWAEKEDPRITNIGKIIRKTRIDELPQLISVIKGDMSLIGPRPERRIFIEEFKKDIPNFEDRLLVMPGLSGWAQVNGGYDLSVKEKFELDIFYINNLSFKLDMLIFFKTIFVILKRDGAR